MTDIIICNVQYPSVQKPSNRILETNTEIQIYRENVSQPFNHKMYNLLLAMGAPQRPATPFTDFVSENNSTRHNRT